MTIRLTQQTWDAIRTDYLNGATAVELARRYGGVKAKSIHARAYKERWREIPLPAASGQELDWQITQRAKMEGLSFEQAAELEYTEKADVLAKQKLQLAKLNGMVDIGLGRLDEAVRCQDRELITKCQELLLATKEIGLALTQKVNLERSVYGLIPAYSREMV